MSGQPLPCIDDVALSYDSQALTIHFALKSSADGLWTAWLFGPGYAFPILGKPVGMISPEVFFDWPLYGFPRVGNVGVFTALATSQPTVCGDVKVIDTGKP